MDKIPNIPSCETNKPILTEHTKTQTEPMLNSKRVSILNQAKKNIDHREPRVNVSRKKIETSSVSIPIKDQVSTICDESFKALNICKETDGNSSSDSEELNILLNFLLLKYQELEDVLINTPFDMDKAEQKKIQQNIKSLALINKKVSLEIQKKSDSFRIKTRIINLHEQLKNLSKIVTARIVLSDTLVQISQTTAYAKIKARPGLDHPVKKKCESLLNQLKILQKEIDTLKEHQSSHLLNLFIKNEYPVVFNKLNELCELTPDTELKKALKNLLIDYQDSWDIKISDYPQPKKNRIAFDSAEKLDYVIAEDTDTDIIVTVQTSEPVEKTSTLSTEKIAPPREIKVGSYAMLQPPNKAMAVEFKSSLNEIIKEYFEISRSYASVVNGSEYVDENEFFKRQGKYNDSVPVMLKKYDQCFTMQLKKTLPSKLAVEIQNTPRANDWAKKLRNPTHKCSLYKTDLQLDRFEVTTPLAHTQVSIVTPDEHVKLSANDIYVDSQHKGIAMQAPFPQDLGSLLTLVKNNRAKVFLDLTNNRDRYTMDKYNSDMLDWSQVGVESGVTDVYIPTKKNSEDLNPTVDYKVEKLSEKVLIKSIKEKDYRLIIRKFSVLSTDSASKEPQTFTQINFPDWPDGKPLEPQVLIMLINQVSEQEKAYPNSTGPVVNCIAGKGRTGSFFVGQDLVHKNQQGKLTADNCDQSMLNALMQVRISRAGDMVQTPQQAKALFDLGMELTTNLT